MSDTVKKTRGRPRKQFELDPEADPMYKTMYNSWCAQKKAKNAYYQRNREHILQNIKEKKSLANASDLVATKT